MPWHVTKSSKCPDSKPWAVVKDTDGSIVACHATEGSAKKQMAALYANEPGMNDAGTETDNTEAVMADDCGCTEHEDGTRAVDNSAWDGPAAMSNCASKDSPGECYRAICAGRKSGDAALQSSWALPHHKTPGGAPNADGVRNSLSRLPQTQGLTNASAAKAHLEAHLAAIQSAEGNSMDPDHTHSQRASAPPTDNLFRMADFAIRDAATDGEPDDGLTLDGYAAVFNRETVIDSWEGRFKEKIAPGAMRKSFRERPPKMQFDHGKHPMVGSIPIASVSSITEEVDADLAPEGGAHVVARLFDNWLVQPVRDAIAAHAITGMSFRFSVVREEWADHTGKVIKDPEVLRDALWRSWVEDVPEDELLVRTLKEVKVPELGPVMWPAYAETSVGVRNKVEIDLATLRTDPAQRRALAEAVLLADAAEREEIESPEPTQRAEDHDEIPNDPPQVTVKADKHESPHERVFPSRRIDIALRDMRSRLKSIPDKKE